MFDYNLALNQLTHTNNGSCVLACMIGAKNFAFSQVKNCVQFDFRGCKKASRCIITLGGNDLYTMAFYSKKRTSLYFYEYLPVETMTDIYFTNLKSIFERFTGLYLSI